MNLDATKMKDWEIAEAMEEEMVPFYKLGLDLGLQEEELIPIGRKLGKIDYARTMARIKDKPRGKYIDITAITPTPLGEGKTTTAIGLIEGLGKIGKKAVGCIRQQSGGPTFNIKGSAAGGGLAQCVPLTEFSIRLTGDIDSITNAHNLAMVALTARMQHENNYDDATLAKKNLRRLDIDPDRISMKWVMDFCAQSLRNIVIGQGGKMDGFEMKSGFAITVSSEIMAILSVAKDLKDLRERMGKIVVAYDKKGKEVTTADLEVDGAMTAWMCDAINPTLLQTLEGQPVFVHAGPFANIAIGQSSIIADQLATRLGEYTVTESGFGADIGFQKFWDLKCRFSGIHPDAVVLVVTIRALKMHGGGPAVKPGVSLDEAYTKENLQLLEKGCCNMIRHIKTIKMSGIKPVVCINHFFTDTENEIALVRKIAAANGAHCAVSKHWLHGGDGAIELAEAVVQACEEPKQFKFLYDKDLPVRDKIDLIARKVYGADGVEYTATALEKIKRFEADPDAAKLGVCMVKTHLSISHDPSLQGCIENWTLPINDILVYKGAGFIVPVAGSIKLMPGTCSDPACRRIDVDVETGKVKGLF